MFCFSGHPTFFPTNSRSKKFKEKEMVSEGQAKTKSATPQSLIHFARERKTKHSKLPRFSILFSS